MAGERRRNRRETQAEDTRREIINEARKLFAEQGYAATTVVQIAERAGVSVQTIYNSVQSKRKIVSLLVDMIDEENEVRELAARIPTTTDPRELLTIAVDISRNINERSDDIIATIYNAAATEDEIRAVREESRRRHRGGIGRLADRLEDLGALAPHLDAEEAADVIAALTDVQVARTFVHEYGWTWDRWHTWTIDALAALVLPGA